MNVYDNKQNTGNYLLSIAKQITEINEKMRYYGTDQPIYNSEIHVIKRVKENDGIHITALANLLGVTKGSVSEVIRKIEKKDLIKKEIADENLSKLCIRLTEKGEIAYTTHEELHAKFNNEIEQILSEHSEQEREFLINFLGKLDETLTNFDDEQ